MAWFCGPFVGPLFPGRSEEVATPRARDGGSIAACGGFLLLPLLRRCGEPRASAGPCRWWRYISSPLRFHVSLARAHHQGPPKVNMWEDPLSPSKWKEEHVGEKRVH
ncbi:unnamed protein product [Musa textilis]